MKLKPQLFLTDTQAQANTLSAPYVCFTLRKLKPWEPLTLFRLMIKRFYHNAGTWCVSVVGPLTTGPSLYHLILSLAVLSRIKLSMFWVTRGYNLIKGNYRVGNQNTSKPVHLKKYIYLNDIHVGITFAFCLNLNKIIL